MPGPQTVDDRCDGKAPHPKPGFPQSGKSGKPWAFASSPNRAQTAPLTGRLRTNTSLQSLSGNSAPTPRADLMPPPVSPTGHLRLPPLLRSDHYPAMVALPATDEARTHLGRLPSSPADDLALTARSDHSRPCRHFRQPMSPGHISGICHPRQQTTFGLSIRSGCSRPCRHFRQQTKPGQTSGVRHPRQLTAFWPTTRSGHLRQWRPSRNRWSPDTLRAHGPHWSTIDGSQIIAARRCHCCRSRQIQRSFSNKTHLSRHDK